MSRWSALLFSLSLLAFAGCAETGMVEDASVAMTERNDYKNARSAGTSAALASFIERYPQSSLREQAQKELDDAVWRETQGTNTPAAYLGFARNKPRHAMAGEARNRCRRMLADAKGGESDYFDYLRSYPNDPDADALRQALKTVRFNAVSRSSDPDAELLFATEYPKTPEAAKLLASIQERAYAAAQSVNSRLAYQFFLKRYPNAPQAAQAQAKLDLFGAPQVQHGNPADLKRVLPELRRASPQLFRQECRLGLGIRLGSSANLFGAEEERLRGQLTDLAKMGGTSVPAFCSEQVMVVPPGAQQTASNAVRALAVMMERKQYLNSVLAGPERIAKLADRTAEQAGAMADASESSELEIEALYGNMPADPQQPDESAAKNDREAVRRAQHAAELVLGMSQKDELDEIAAATNRQVDLLVDIIAALEKPASTEAAKSSEEEITQ
jgi:hypothetical protein